LRDPGAARDRLSGLHAASEAEAIPLPAQALPEDQHRVLLAIAESALAAAWRADGATRYEALSAAHDAALSVLAPDSSPDLRARATATLTSVETLRNSALLAQLRAQIAAGRTRSRRPHLVINERDLVEADKTDDDNLIHIREKKPRP
jgi:hypothetical protein